jgi:hypothetical protein
VRAPGPTLALIAALAACTGDDNQITSGFPGVIIAPVRSSITGRVTFHDASGNPHLQAAIAMTDAPNLCSKVTANPAYFQTPTENFSAILLWIPPDTVGTGFIGQSFSDGTGINTEVVLGAAAGGILKFPGVSPNGGIIVVNQFNSGPGGEAIGNFDVAVRDSGGVPREMLGKFKAIACDGFNNAQLP